MKGIRVILKSGATLPDITCEAFNVSTSQITGKADNIHIKRAECPKPIHIDVNEVAAVVKLWDDDEKPREDPCKGCSYKAHSEQISKQNDCNDCGQAKTCQYRPPLGGMVRINCPLWKHKRAEVRK